MALLNGEETVCAGQFFENNASSWELTQRGMHTSSQVLEAIRDCQQRPRTEGGPATTADCEDCGLRVCTKVAKGLREMTTRVNQRRSVLEM